MGPGPGLVIDFCPGGRDMPGHLHDRSPDNVQGTSGSGGLDWRWQVHNCDSAYAGPDKYLYLYIYIHIYMCVAYIRSWAAVTKSSSDRSACRSDGSVAERRPQKLEAPRGTGFDPRLVWIFFCVVLNEVVFRLSHGGGCEWRGQTTHLEHFFIRPSAPLLTDSRINKSRDSSAESGSWNFNAPHVNGRAATGRGNFKLSRLFYH